MRILIVEDDEDSRVYLQRALTSKGHEIEVAEDGLVALKATYDAPPDIIISDILMPKMDGYVLCCNLKGDPSLKDIPFIFYTATYLDPKDKELGLSLGASRYLEKPMELSDLLKVIENVMEEEISGQLTETDTTKKSDREIDGAYQQALARKLEKKITELEEQHEVAKLSQQMLRQSEERFRDFAESAADRFWESDENHRITYISPVPEGSNLQQSEKIIGRKREELTDCKFKEEDVKKLYSYLNAHKPFRDFQYTFIRVEDGREIYVQTSGKPIFNKDGTFKGYRGTNIDITEAKLREDQLRQAQKMEAVGQLTSGISHDFNNILAELSINLGLIDSHAKKNKDIHARIVTAQQSILRGANLTGQLLAFSREQNLTPEPTDIGTLVTGMNDLLGRSLGETITIDIQTQPDLWPALIDRHQLENAILNLSINARDAMPSGGTLTIDCLNEHIDQDNDKLRGDISPGDYTVVAVADTGTGIPEKVLNRIFDPFFTTKKVGQGTGLGLSMVDGFIRQSNGYLNIESEEGIGTSISLYLPRAKELPATKPKKSKIQKTREGHGETILLVEDNANLRKLAIEMLDRLNYKVIDGDDGSEAQNLFNGHDGKIDLLLSDVVLPHGNTGPGIASKLREQNADLKVLLMSGYTDLKNRTSGESEIKFPLINKPFGKEDLALAIHNALQADIK